VENNQLWLNVRSVWPIDHCTAAFACPEIQKLSPPVATRMDLNHNRAQSPSQIPASSSKYHHPYFTPAEVEYLSEKQRGKLSVTQEEKTRQQACGFLEAVGAKIGLSVILFFCCRVLY
jgi:hypothetical protein